MIISRTPFRVSFVGGGTDLPAFYRRWPGAVVSVGINKYMYVTVSRRFDDSIRVSYTQTEIVDSIDDLQHEIEIRLSCEVSTVTTTRSGRGSGSMPAMDSTASSSSLLREARL